MKKKIDREENKEEKLIFLEFIKFSWQKTTLLLGHNLT